MLIVAKGHVRQHQLALALDKDLLGSIDHDVVDRLVGEQRLERAEAEHVVEQDGDEVALLDLVELDFLLAEDLRDDAGELLLQFGAAKLGGNLAVDPFHDQGVDARNRLVDARPPRHRGRPFAGDLPLPSGVQDAVEQHGDQLALVDRVDRQAAFGERRADDFLDLARHLVAGPPLCGGALELPVDDGLEQGARRLDADRGCRDGIFACWKRRRRSPTPMRLLSEGAMRRRRDAEMPVATRGKRRGPRP